MDKSIKEMTASEIDAEIKAVEKEFKGTPSGYNRNRLEMLQEAKIKRKSL